MNPLPILQLVFGFMSLSYASKSAKAAQASTKAQQRQQEVIAAAERRKAIRRAQQERATAVSSAYGAGAYGSGVKGGVASVSSRLGTNLGYGSQLSGLSREANQFASLSQQYAGRSNLFGLGYAQAPEIVSFLES